MLLLVILVCALAGPVMPQVYDMANGNDEGLLFPCPDGPFGIWIEESASLYPGPGSPIGGLVLTSSKTTGACLDTPTTVHINPTSQLYINIRIPYRVVTDYFIVWLIRKTGNEQWFQWITVTGPINPGSEWMQISQNAPVNIVEGEYLVRLWDMSSTEGVSLRYMEITTFAYNSSSTTTSTPTTTKDHHSTTVSPLSTEGTTERYTTPVRTTERYSTPPTTEGTTERFSTAPHTTERYSTTAAPPIQKT